MVAHGPLQRDGEPPLQVSAPLVGSAQQSAWTWTAKQTAVTWTWISAKVSFGLRDAASGARKQ
jgi:hypothetical protein